MANIIFNSMRGEYSVIRLMDEHIDIDFVVQKEKNEYIDFVFGVEPRNRMIAQYEVSPRPRIKEMFIPIRDSFVDEEEPFFNFGRRSILRIAQQPNSDGAYRRRTFLQFERTVTELQDDLHIISAELEFTLARNVPDQFDLIELSTLNRGFQEYGVTWMNQPTRREFIDVYPISGKIEEKVKFDISDHFKRWYDEGQVLNGFVMKEISGYNAGEVVFYSRESNNQPYLKIQYFDPDFSLPRHNELDMSFHILERRDEHIDFDMEVKSFAKTTYLPFEFKPLSVTGELMMHFGVNKPDFRFNFDVFKKMSDYKRIGFRVYYTFTDLSTQIFFGVNRPELYFEFNPRVINDFFWRFNVTKEFLKFDFESTESTHNLEFDLNVRAVEYLDFDFFVDDNFRYFDFEVTEQTRNIEFDLDVRAVEDLDFATTVTKDSSRLNFEVIEQTHNIEFKSLVRAVEDLTFDTVVTKDDVRLEFESIDQTHNVEFNVDVRAIDDLGFNFDISNRSVDIYFEVIEENHNLEIDAKIRAVNDIDIDMFINSNFLYFNFEVTEQTRNLEFNSKIRAVEDLDFEFFIDENFRYFDFEIIESNHNLEFNSKIRAVEDLDFEFFIDENFRYFDFEVTEQTRNLEFDAKIRAVEDLDFVSTVTKDTNRLIFEVTKQTRNVEFDLDVRAIKDLDFYTTVNKNEILLNFYKKEQTRNLEFFFNTRVLSDVDLMFAVSKTNVPLIFESVEPNHYLPFYLDAKAVDSKFMFFSVYKKLDTSLDFIFDKSILNIDVLFDVNAVNDVDIHFDVFKEKDEYKEISFSVRKINDLTFKQTIRAVEDVELEFDWVNYTLPFYFVTYRRTSRIRFLNLEVRAVSDLMLDFEARQKKDLRFRMDVVLQRSNDLVFEFEIDGEVITRKAYAFIM